MKQLNVPFKWMFTIVDRGKSDSVLRILGTCGALMHMVCLGRGTAKSEMLAYLGLDEPEKDIVISLVPAGKVSAVLDGLSSEIDFYKPGSGIVFTVPPTAVNSLFQKYIGEEKEVFRMEEMQYELIAVTVRRGMTELVMEAAAKVGARGGTVLKARSLEADTAEEFLGTPLQEEKEILLIVVPTVQKQTVMHAICNDILTRTGERVMACSLPLDDMMGLKL